MRTGTGLKSVSIDLKHVRLKRTNSAWRRLSRGTDRRNTAIFAEHAAANAGCGWIASQWRSATAFAMIELERPAPSGLPDRPPDQQSGQPAGNTSDSLIAQRRAKSATFRKCVARGTPFFWRRVSARRQLPNKGRERALDPFALSAFLATVYDNSWRCPKVSVSERN